MTPNWRLEFQKSAEHDLVSLDVQIRRRIIDKLSWLLDNFDDITPLPLGGSWKGFFKLRVGNWRVVYSVNFSKKLIFVQYIDLRDKVYKIKNRNDNQSDSN